MRKKILLLFALQSIFTCSTIFTSCGDDDNEEGNSTKDTITKKDTVYKTKDLVSVSGFIERESDSIYYVDLGLPSGRKWVCYNIGATSPIEYGNYYAWGECYTKEDYSWSTYNLGYKDSLDSTGKPLFLYKYEPHSSIDLGERNNFKLEKGDDVGTNLKNCRMPTAEEMQELKEGCDWTWTKDFKGTKVAGMLGISKTNGNTFFLPASGQYRGVKLDVQGYCGVYWSANLADNDDYSAKALVFYNGVMELRTEYRCDGYSIRAVVDK